MDVHFNEEIDMEKIGEETVLLFPNGDYGLLNETASYVVDMLLAGACTADIALGVSTEWGISLMRAQEDVSDCVSALSNTGVIKSFDYDGSQL